MLEFIEERLQLGTWSWDISAGVLTWSSQLYRILGFDPADTEPSFDLYRRIVHPDDRLDFTDAAGLAASNRLAERQFRIIRPSGQLRWIRSYGQIVHDINGVPERMVGFAMDVTDARAGEAALAERAALREALQALLGGAIWNTAADGTVLDTVEWWQSWSRVTDQSTPPKGGWARLEVVHPDDRALVRAAWDKAIAGRSQYRCSFRLRQRDGAYRRYVSSAAPIVTKGELVGWAGFSTPEVPGRFVEAARYPRSEQIRAARAFLGWSAEELASRANVSFSTVRRMESGGSAAVGERSSASVLAALEAHGVRFIEDQNGGIGVVLEHMS